MISDIDNWLNYLEKLDKKDKSKPIKKRKKNDQERTSNLNELKTSGIDNLYSTIEECKFKGRELTNFLSKLEFTFTTTRNMLRNEKKDDNDYLKRQLKTIEKLSKILYKNNKIVIHNTERLIEALNSK